MRELENFVRDPENPWTNLELAMWYHNINHTASAITFYLRCAERTDDDTLAYGCLIQMFRLFKQQGGRKLTALNCINRAISLLPNRPEAYWVLSQHYEHQEHWQTSYMNAMIGLQFADHDLPQLTMTIGYPGKYALLFQKSVAAWWWGKRDESRELTKDLFLNYSSVMDSNHLDAVKNNLANCNIDIESSQVKNTNNLIVSDQSNAEKWRVTDWPTLEITTNIAKKGCVVDCVFCPQRTLEKSYTDDKRFMTLDEFKFMIDKVPSEVRITFAGFTEPWLNKHCTDMLLYAHEKGHPISVFTTAVGMKPEDVERLADIPYAGQPNGGFTLHLPDKERMAKHPVNANYIKVIEKFKELEHRFQNFYVMSMAEEIHEDIEHIYSEAVVPSFWNRAGNLTGEAMLKPELDKVMDRVQNAPVSDDPRTCGCVEDLYHNILLPNGDVSLCCMDYSLEYILGNLFEHEYNDIMPQQGTCFDLCRKCENGVAYVPN